MCMQYTSIGITIDIHESKKKNAFLFQLATPLLIHPKNLLVLFEAH